MPLFAGKTPAERNKTIAALVLGVVAVLFLGRMLFGSSTTTTKTTTTQRTTTRGTNAGGPNQPGDTQADIDFPQPIPEIVNASYAGSDGGRNIFAFYEPPVKPTPDPNAAAIAAANLPTPTPPPPPPLALNNTAPNLIYARAEEFALVANGDKFTPETRLYLDGQELPTTYQSPQQLTAQVSAALISVPGTRAIVARTPDGQLYSNQVALNVAEAPKPQLTYIGLLGGPRYNDKALLKRTNNEVVTVTRGDIVDQRFRVTSISERSVDFVDTQLKIKHTLPYVENKPGSGLAGPRPYLPQPPRPDADDDDEPQ
ncbi:MAG TPA: hypothetical protein VF546_15015 [Pyrinomonadaceae bacterium]|jgi:hypothetical protein